MKNRSRSIRETGKGVSKHKQGKPHRHLERAVNLRAQKHTSNSWPGACAELGHPQGPLAQPPPQGHAWSLCCLYSIPSPLRQAGHQQMPNYHLFPFLEKKINCKPFPLPLRAGPGVTFSQQQTGRWLRLVQGRGDSSCVAPGGKDVSFLGALGCIPFPGGAVWDRWEPKFSQH